MADIISPIGAPAPQRVTEQFPSSCNPQCDSIDALDAASCFLTSALTAVLDLAREADSSTACTVAYLVELGMAAVDAAASAIREARNDA